jgi:hypothetical protein
VVRIDEKLLYTALAFVAATPKGATAADVLKLAELVKAFCDEHVRQVGLSGGSDEASESVDALIEKHVRELRDQEITRLPDDRDTLIRLYDRLHARKNRRLQRGFYATASEARISDLILRLMDEEIEAGGELM